MRVKLKDLGVISTGNTPSKNVPEFYDSNDIGFVKPDIISDSQIDYIDVTQEYLSNSARNKARIVKKNTVFVTCIGSIGKVGIAQSQELAFNQQINAIAPNEKVLYKYLAYCIFANKKRLQAIANAPVVPIINKSQFEDFEIDIALEIEQQKKIVKILDAVDKIIKLRKQQLAELDELVKARFVELFGMCDTYELLEDSNIYISDGNYSSKYPTADEFVEEGIPFIRASNMEMNTIVDSDMYFITKEKHAILLKGHVKAGDVLITTRGATIGKIACVPPRHEDSNINAQIVLLRCPNYEYNPLFLSWYLKLDNTQAEIQKLISGSAQPQLPIKRLVQLRILKPNIDLQKQFAVFVEQTDKSKFAVQKALDEAQTLFDSLMQQYFG